MTKRNLKRNFESKRKNQNNSKKNKITLRSQVKRIKNVNKHDMINYNKKEKWTNLNLRKKTNNTKKKVKNKINEGEKSKNKINMNKTLM